MAEPRTRVQRIADTRRRFDVDRDAWLATTSGDRPWLVPLSFLWWQDRLLLATPKDSPTVRNAVEHPVIRLAIGELRDVVLIDGTVIVEPLADLPEEIAAAYLAKQDTDPRQWADAALWVTPTAIQAWREENELRGRYLMKDGGWLD